MRKYMLYSVALALAFVIPVMAEDAAKEKKVEKIERKFAGEITAVDASSITLKNKDSGETKTLKLTKDTKITDPQIKLITAADLKVGQVVGARFTEDGTCLGVWLPRP